MFLRGSEVFSTVLSLFFFDAIKAFARMNTNKKQQQAIQHAKRAPIMIGSSYITKQCPVPLHSPLLQQ